MNKKGFTLVELLAVIVILGIVTTVVATKGFGAFGKTKEKIEEENKKEIQNGISMLLAEVNNCDDDMKDYQELKKYFKGINTSGLNSCSILQDRINAVKINYTNLITNGYITNTKLEDISVAEQNKRFTYNSSSNTFDEYTVPGVTFDTRNCTFESEVINKNIRATTFIQQISLDFKTFSDGKLSFDTYTDPNSINIYYIKINNKNYNGGEYDLKEDTKYSISIRLRNSIRANTNINYKLYIDNLKITSTLFPNTDLNISTYISGGSISSSSYDCLKI